MAHDHSHHHHHQVEITQLNRAFIAGIVLNSAFVIIEVIAGFATNSLALLTDAGHNLSDVAALILSLIAFRLTQVKPNSSFTYGYSKTTILVALVNAVVLLIAIGGIGYEAVHRFLKPEPMQGTTMAVVAGIGILVNGVSALLFLRDKDKDLNVKGAYLHLAADALVSLGVVVAGVIIVFTDWFWLDSVVSLVIMIVILFGTWSLLWDSLRLSLDAVPRNVDMEQVKAEVMKVKGITDIHHIHIWALSTRTNAMTAHLIINENLTSSEEHQLKEMVKHELIHLNIQHTTLETERGKGKCEDEKC
ncbi:MAG: cation diffusion facilitator family transporter [Bacteroidota bacterium]